MIHANFQGHHPSGSGKEGVFKVSTIFGNGGHIGHVTWTKYINFLSLFVTRLHIN